MTLSFKANYLAPPTASSSASDPSMQLSRVRVAAARADNSGRVYRVYCDGVFDLFHLAHMRMFEQAKKALGSPEKVHLIAGVCSDELVHQFKGKTVMSHSLRCESVRHCRWVDEVLPDAPWVLTDEYLSKHKIDFVAHDAIPYKDTSGSASNSGDVYAHIKEKGMFLETQRTEGLSTSDIIVTIIRDYDDYVIRNLDRGYSKQELNVGASWTVRASFHDKQKQLKQAVLKMKGESKATEDAAIAFIREFNPKYAMRKSKSINNVSELEQEPTNTPTHHNSDANTAVNRGNGQQTDKANNADLAQSEHFDFSPTVYINTLKTTLPERSAGLLHHSAGLAWAVLETAGYVLSYFNPFSYCQGPKRKKG